MVPMYPLSCTDCVLLLFGALRLSNWCSLRMRLPRLLWGMGGIYLPRGISTSACVSAGALLRRFIFYKEQQGGSPYTKPTQIV